ncbi:MAG: DMT family transporter [Gammaproteobacteria bacterium]|nr:DMT family transporter [Gammaproteobacteria bacterium]
MKENKILVNWLLLLCLILLWGTSFLFTAIAVDTIDPLSIVFFRVLIGAIVLTGYLYFRQKQLPRVLKSWLIFLLFGFVGNLLPFFLISWGQQTINSGLAGMIMAIMPLITMLLAHYFIEGENLNVFKIMGFLLGITGISILLGPVFSGSMQEMLSGIAILIAAGSYAVNTILVRRLPRFDPVVAGAGLLIAASAALLIPWLLLNKAVSDEVSTMSLLSLVWLGIGPTGVATIILFVVIDRAGPTFLSTINYLIPVVAFLAGVLVLNEPLSWVSLVALMIILIGIALTRFRASHNARV